MKKILKKKKATSKNKIKSEPRAFKLPKNIKIRSNPDKNGNGIVEIFHPGQMDGIAKALSEIYLSKKPKSKLTKEQVVEKIKKENGWE